MRTAIIGKTPLFNKFSPLQDEQLRQRIQALMDKCGFHSKGIFVMDGSKRSGHGNAYFTGFGNNKRIVFFDTLLESLEPAEIEAVLAHELGHFKLKHIQKRLLSTAALSLAALALLFFQAEDGILDIRPVSAFLLNRSSDLVPVRVQRVVAALVLLAPAGLAARVISGAAPDVRLFAPSGRLVAGSGDLVVQGRSFGRRHKARTDLHDDFRPPFRRNRRWSVLLRHKCDRWYRYPLARCIPPFLLQ